MYTILVSWKKVGKLSIKSFIVKIDLRHIGPTVTLVDGSGNFENRPIIFVRAD